MRLILLFGALVATLALAAFLQWPLALGGGGDYARQKADYELRGDVSAIRQSLSTEAAYRAIPHPLTPYLVSLATIPAPEADYLESLFALTDTAVVERVRTQQSLRAGSFPPGGGANYDAIVDRIMALDTPARLLPVEGMIVEAIREQRSYLAAWRQSGDEGFFSPHASQVRASHKRLIGAYNRLMRLYPEETPRNQEAFYNHLCALDFI